MIGLYIFAVIAFAIADFAAGHRLFAQIGKTVDKCSETTGNRTKMLECSLLILECILLAGLVITLALGASASAGLVHNLYSLM